MILLVEDNEDDAFLIELSFQKARIVNSLRTVRTGEQAVAYLGGEGVYADRAAYPLPRLLLLDLKLPGIDGFEVLRWIRQRPELSHLHVAVVTASGDVREANLAFRSGANSFIIKPVDFMRFAQFSEALAGCWLWVDEALVEDTSALPAILEGHVFEPAGAVV